jgi:Uncharacterized protein conserved in bacteria (DUF2332)
MQGDALIDLPALAAQAPPDDTLIIFHSALLGYISSSDERLALANAITRLKAVWISNEAPAFSVCAHGMPKAACPIGQFLLLRNKKPIAFTDPHGRTIDWLRSSRTESVGPR